MVIRIANVYRPNGFTLIELMVVMAVIATLLSIVAPRYFNSIDRSREAVLRQNLSIMRDAIDKFYSDTGKYPLSLNQLVEEKYIRAIPIDPMTESSQTWIEVPPSDPEIEGMYDLRSSSDRQALDGSFYDKW